MIRLPAEWEHQEAVLITWPHKDTDWASFLGEADALYFALVNTLLDHVNVIISVSPKRHQDIVAQLHKHSSNKTFTFFTYPSECNDTWARDHGPITVEQYPSSESAHEQPTLRLVNFTFNAWGNKFEHSLDNALNNTLHQAGAFGNTPIQHHDLVLEGGSIESNGEGLLLTTEQCLLNPNRNPHLTKTELEDALAQTLGIQKILWLKNGYLAGDDTDSHIDTLARLAPDNKIVYVKCTDANDEHFDALTKMEAELSEFTNQMGHKFSLIPLPMPSGTYNDSGQRLPATYANFLITNQAVLVPIYHDPNDDIALAQIQTAFPDRKIIGLDCRVLIQMFGSLHCITMQLPAGIKTHEPAPTA